MRHQPIQHLRSALELWAGVECSVVRVEDGFYDQLDRSGHATRGEDLDRITELGIRTLRYPILWERTAPDGLSSIDWTWAHDRLERLRNLGVRPIVGLIHHGSGPPSTSLVESNFAEGLASYAGAVARRFPWVEDYSPVNEPLTTARFSGLYGHWYPHGRDDRTFARALINQCRGVSLAMRAVREVNSSARLIQTEDLGQTSSTPRLSYQADFENERRWLSFDLLCGHVGRGHPMWNYLLGSGVAERELGWFLDDPCPPDVVGLNYYLTSERFLDDREQRYPARLRGGNGQHAYADLEAVRVCIAGTAGAESILRQAWERYKLPLAITEAHLGCTREEQMRWFLEVWEAAQAAREDGVDVRAVTAWAVLGSFDWNSLMTRHKGYYEPGAFDLRSPQPRPTALASMLRALAQNAEPDHPVLDTPGWWQRPERLLYPPTSHGPVAPERKPRARGRERSPRSVFIAGGSGQFGQAFTRLCDQRGLAHQALSRCAMDITDESSIASILDDLKPWAVVNAAGFSQVEDAEGDPEECHRINADGAAILASACALRGITLLGFSSADVFDGDRDTPYRENDPVNPRNVYGKSKVEMERRVLEILPTALIVRTSSCFSPWEGTDFVTLTLECLAAGRPFAAADDQVVSPTYLPDLVHAALDLLIDGESGLWHLTNVGSITWANFARRVAELYGLDPALVVGIPASSLGQVAQRPAYCALESERGFPMPGLEDALSRYVRDAQVGKGTDPMGDENPSTYGDGDRQPEYPSVGLAISAS